MITNKHCEVGQVLENRLAQSKKKMLQIVIEDHGWDVLWRCRDCGKYWEATYEGRYAEDEALTCLEDEEVQLRWGDQLRDHKKQTPPN